ncbi:MAG: DUF5683 domain-containing protein [Candidatus Eisenbacteria bacterium]|nr:DUF5683 domain-containing protein [Candidatus Eisenbacteria bacterium]
MRRPERKREGIGAGSLWLAAALSFATFGAAEVACAATHDAGEDRGDRGDIAQAVAPPTTPGGGLAGASLRIRSEPPGALVVLEGEHEWRGVTPWDLQRGLQGRYAVTASLDGYERWQRTIDLEPGAARNLDIRLSRKQAWKAGLRSLFIPGWGQFYAGRPAKGTAFLVGTALAAGGLLWTEIEYQDRVDDFESARNAYLHEGRLDQFDERRAAAERAQDRADRAYDWRQGFLYATGGVWALSLIDALFFFPSPSEGSFASISPWGNDGPELGLRPREDGAMLVVRWNPQEGGSR